MTPYVVIAAMLALVLFHNEFFAPTRCCPLCGGRREHGKNCPQKDRDAD